MMKITAEDFIRMFDCPGMIGEITAYLREIDTAYTVAGTDDFHRYILFVLKAMATPRASRTHEENLAVWESGWAQHFNVLKKKKISSDDLKPKYFRPAEFFRFDKKIVLVDNPNIEYDLFTLARRIIFEKYLSGYEDIYELGCGSCQNLFMISRIFPSARLHGFDWTKASNRIAKGLAKFIPNKIEGKNFDMMQVPKKNMIEPGSAVFTVHAMEQLGAKFEEFAWYLIKCKPGIVVNYEPIVEMYDQEDLADYLAYFYSVKRNYLNGYWSFLENLAKEGKIEIVKAVRPCLGGVIHEASLIVWRPV